MKFRNLLSHLTAALALAVVVILVIDLFFNSAMYLAAGREFKYLCMALSVCARVRRHAKERNKMKLCFKQRFFSWFDSYDIYDASTGATAFTVEGKLAWGHCLHILDAQGRHIATVKERVLTFLPKFDLYIGERSIGTIRKELTLFRPAFVLDFNGWRVQGSFLEWDYTIEDAAGRTVARIAKELLRWTDTYTIDVPDARDALCALMVVLAIDAEKCSRGSN